MATGSDNTNTDIDHMHLKSQYSMGQLDFMRYHELLKQVDEIGFNVGLERPQRFIRAYFSVLEQLYINLQATMTPEQRTMFDAEFDRMRNLIEGTKYTKTLILSLKDMNKKLIRIKQAAGMGLSVQKEYTDKEIKKTIYGIDS